jgi:hypothetical protein
VTAGVAVTRTRVGVGDPPPGLFAATAALLERLAPERR